eukprot:1545157-Amphidinium_carterae.1
MTSSKARILAAEAHASRMREHRRSQRRSLGNYPPQRRSASIDNSSVGSGGREPVRRLSSGVSWRAPGSSASRQRSLRLGGFTASSAEARVRACLPHQSPPLKSRGRSSSEPRANGLLAQSSKASL